MDFPVENDWEMEEGCGERGGGGERGGDGDGFKLSSFLLGVDGGDDLRLFFLLSAFL